MSSASQPAEKGATAGKIAVVVGGGQQPGETTGNGRATCLRFAEEGAAVLVIDQNLEAAEETVAIIKGKGGSASSLAADITREADCKAIADTCVARHGRIDILHNNVGRARGDKGSVELGTEVWDELMAMNLRGMFLTIKHVLPVMRRQKSGAIINISSTSSFASGQTLTYKTSKGAINSMTQHMAFENARYGIRISRPAARVRTRLATKAALGCAEAGAATHSSPSALLGHLSAWRC